MLFINLDYGRECIAYERKEKCVHFFGGRNLKKRGNLDDLGIDVCTTLQFIFKKNKLELRELDSSASAKGQVNSNESRSSTNLGEFPDQLRN